MVCLGGQLAQAFQSQARLSFMIRRWETSCVHVTDQVFGSSAGGGFDRDGFTSVVSRRWVGNTDNAGWGTQFSREVGERLTTAPGSNSHHITNDPSLPGWGVANAVVLFTMAGILFFDTATADGSG